MKIIRALLFGLLLITTSHAQGIPDTQKNFSAEDFGKLYQKMRERSMVGYGEGYLPSSYWLSSYSHTNWFADMPPASLEIIPGSAQWTRASGYRDAYRDPGDSIDFSRVHARHPYSSWWVREMQAWIQDWLPGELAYANVTPVPGAWISPSSDLTGSRSDFTYLVEQYNLDDPPDNQERIFDLAGIPFGPTRYTTNWPDELETAYRIDVVSNPDFSGLYTFTSDDPPPEYWSLTPEKPGLQAVLYGDSLSAWTAHVRSRSTGDLITYTNTTNGTIAGYYEFESGSQGYGDTNLTFDVVETKIYTDGTNGWYETGDILGPWILNELHSMLDEMYIAEYHLSGEDTPALTEPGFWYVDAYWYEDYLIGYSPYNLEYTVTGTLEPPVDGHYADMCQTIEAGPGEIEGIPGGYSIHDGTPLAVTPSVGSGGNIIPDSWDVYWRPFYSVADPTDPDLWEMRLLLAGDEPWVSETTIQIHAPNLVPGGAYLVVTGAPDPDVTGLYRPDDGDCLKEGAGYRITSGDTNLYTDPARLYIEHNPDQKIQVFAPTNSVFPSDASMAGVYVRSGTGTDTVFTGPGGYSIEVQGPNWAGNYRLGVRLAGVADYEVDNDFDWPTMFESDSVAPEQLLNQELYAGGGVNTYSAHMEFTDATLGDGVVHKAGFGGSLTYLTGVSRDGSTDIGVYRDSDTEDRYYASYGHYLPNYAQYVWKSTSTNTPFGTYLATSIGSDGLAPGSVTVSLLSTGTIYVSHSAFSRVGTTNDFSGEYEAVTSGHEYQAAGNTAYADWQGIGFFKESSGAPFDPEGVYTGSGSVAGTDLSSSSVEVTWRYFERRDVPAGDDEIIGGYNAIGSADGPGAEVLGGPGWVYPTNETNGEIIVFPHDREGYRYLAHEYIFEEYQTLLADRAEALDLSKAGYSWSGGGMPQDHVEHNFYPVYFSEEQVGTNLLVYATVEEVIKVCIPAPKYMSSTYFRERSFGVLDGRAYLYGGDEAHLGDWLIDTIIPNAKMWPYGLVKQGIIDGPLDQILSTNLFASIYEPDPDDTAPDPDDTAESYNPSEPEDPLLLDTNFWGYVIEWDFTY